MEQKNKCTELKVLNRTTILLVFLAILCLIDNSAGAAQEKIDTTEDDTESLMELSLEDLMEIEIRPTATLTKTEQKIIPAAMTIITKEDIENSGARSVDEVLEIYVPNLQIMLHVWETRHLGLRGTMSDRDDKYLLLVNGRVMNDRVHYGAISERDLPMLGDINRIEVVRGPGSAMYGPGALFMVINIITDTPRTFEGAEIRTKLGAIDEFYTWETKWAKKFADDSGLLIYAGAAEQPGTDSRDASFSAGRPFTYRGQSYTGAEEVGIGKLRGYNQAWRDLTKLKLYGQYMKDDFNFWARYTRGGSHYALNTSTSTNWGYPAQGEGYQQLTLWAGNKLEFSDTINVNYSFSYDTLDFERQMSDRLESHRQDEYHTKVILNWQPHEDHSVAVGAEYSHEEFGLKSWGYPDSRPLSSFDLTYWDTSYGGMPRWSTDTVGVLGEYQWKMTDKFTLFLGGRLDWHKYVKKEMFSPRIALVYTPTERDTLKFMAQRSTRANLADVMRYNYEQNTDDNKSDFERMDYYELRWERQQTNNLWFALSGFYSKHRIIAWGGSTTGVSTMGKLHIAGVEVEAAYKVGKAKFTISHGYTKLLEFRLDENFATSGGTQFFTSEPYGYGDDLANWHNHITKLTAHYDATDKLSLDGSLCVYWGIPGKRDFVKYSNNETGETYLDRSAVYQPSIFLNLGMGYEVTDNLKLRAHAHNVLGWLNERFNKRNFGFGNQESGYLLEAPSLSFSMQYTF